MKTLFQRQGVMALALAGAMLASAARADQDIAIQDGRLSVQGKALGEATLNNAVKILRTNYPDVNIVLEPGVGQILIGDVELHLTTPDMDLEAFSIASGRKFVCEEKSAAMPQPSSNAGALPGGVQLLVVKSNSVPTVPTEEKKIQAFNLGPYFSLSCAISNGVEDKQCVQAHMDKLHDIINLTLQAMQGGGQDVVQTEFYPDGDLFIVIGSQRGLDTARAIVSALPGMQYLASAPATPAGISGGANIPGALTREIVEMVKELKALDSSK